MNLFKAISPGALRFQEIELSLLLGWALLYPGKTASLYPLGFMCLLTVFTLAKLSVLKNVAVTRFSLLLLLFNAVLVFSAFFSPHPHKSLLFVAAVVMVSLWIFLFYMEKEDSERYLRLAALVISLSSLGVVILFALQKGWGPVTLFFENPVLQATAAALAVLVFLAALLRQYGHVHLVLLALNTAALLINASTAVLLGLAVFGALMIIRSQRRRRVIWVAVLLLLALAPVFLRRPADEQPPHDRLAFDPLSAWSMSARMVRSHPWTGVGPGLFAEAAPRFSFNQDEGSSRHGQVPESPHSDYWQVIAETGFPGLVLVFLFLFFVIRRLLSPPGCGSLKPLLAFLLTQMLLSSCVFNLFFIVLFFLLLYGFFPARPRFVSPAAAFRVLLACFLVGLTVVLYVFPFVSSRLLASASREKDPLRRFERLDRAALFTPIAETVPLAKAAVLGSFAVSLKSLDAWVAALENARLAQRLNRNSVDAHIAESELFLAMWPLGDQTPVLATEILEPLQRAEKNAPYNPFIKMRQAVVLRAFARDAEARMQAQAALRLEPDYTAALLFLNDLDGLPADDPLLRQRLAAIRRKARRLGARPGSYLFRLHQLPPSAARE